MNGVECNGYFCDSPRKHIIVNINKPIEEWLPVFIHESCHKDQCIEQCSYWTTKVNDYYDAGDIFDMYVSGTVELNQENLTEVLKQVVEVELDCERRTVDKIVKFNLPLDVTEYTQKANAYIYSHFAIFERREFGAKAAYDIPEIWTKMPVDFNQDYSTINDNILELYNSYIW
jgi:hypothetical protein